jgi:hypothetical protein
MGNIPNLVMFPSPKKSSYEESDFLELDRLIKIPTQNHSSKNLNIILISLIKYINEKKLKNEIISV